MDAGAARLRRAAVMGSGSEDDGSEEEWDVRAPRGLAAPPLHSTAGLAAHAAAAAAQQRRRQRELEAQGHTSWHDSPGSTSVGRGQDEVADAATSTAKREREEVEPERTVASCSQEEALARIAALEARVAHLAGQVRFLGSRL